MEMGCEDQFEGPYVPTGHLVGEIDLAHDRERGYRLMTTNFSKSLYYARKDSKCSYHYPCRNDILTGDNYFVFRRKLDVTCLLKHDFYPTLTKLAA